MKKRKKRGRVRRRNRFVSYDYTISYSRISITFILIIIIGFGFYCIANKETAKEVIKSKDDVELEGEIVSEVMETTVAETEPEIIDLYAKPALNKVTIGDEVFSKNAVLIDLSTNQILADKNSNERIYPASLTKIMTVIVGLEMAENLQDAYMIPEDIFGYLFEADASTAGFQPNEEVKIIDLMYGAMLPSGADATIAIARCISGSEEAFVEKMNEKLIELGIDGTTHFTNTSGLHDDNHYSTVADIAVIFNYALKNPTFRQILLTRTYTSSPTNINPDGVTMTSTMFNRISGNEVEGVTILGGKTGFTDQAGLCLASIANKNGKEYMLVTANASVDCGVYSANTVDAITVYGNYLS
ncbi:MAG: D-alanyl-D-alanine carboxypeptidase [Clostridiales bacterium]|jgi:D-alanyl-D-alanine carboxypeptidase (penicillin-binding protein 5/6)|nr:D-alanyl-D-alanine carboxypeptidase [Clostridiales bacterium]